jgi:hypothetical protein
MIPEDYCGTKNNRIRVFPLCWLSHNVGFDKCEEIHKINQYFSIVQSISLLRNFKFIFEVSSLIGLNLAQSKTSLKNFFHVSFSASQ